MVIYNNQGSIKWYVNGTEFHSGTGYSFSQINLAAAYQQMGIVTVPPSSAYYSKFYLAEYNFIDGQALSAEYFGKTQDGIWVAKAFNGQDNTSGGGSATNNYGARGYRLAFADSSDLGKDTAPTSSSLNHSAANNWTNN